MFGQTTNEELVTQLAKSLEGKMSGYEAILSKHKYLAGDEITLADLFHLPYGVFLAPQKFTYLEDEAKYPNVARYAASSISFHAHTHASHSWWKEIQARPSWQAVKDGISA
jgi:glutathione S-transferase